MSGDVPGAGLGIPPAALSLGRACPCGALAETDAAECRKCRARARWARRRGLRSVATGNGG